MTEAEWQRSKDPRAMLKEVAGTMRRRALLLFAVACGRGFAAPALDRTTLELLDRVEAFAEGTLSVADLQTAMDAAPSEDDPRYRYHGRERVAVAELVRAAAGNSPRVRKTGFSRGRVLRALGEVQNRLARQNEAERRTFLSYDIAREKVHAEQAALLRELIGPLEGVPAIEARWTEWEGGLVVKLARAAYEERAWDRLPVVADALEEAGCTEAALLAHLRSKTVHVRGCWAVDALLGL